MTANAGDVCLIPGLGRSPGEGNGNPLQYSRPGNPRDGGAWRATGRGLTEESDVTYRLNNTRTKWGLSLQYKDESTTYAICTTLHHFNRMKDKNHRTISVDTEQAFDNTTSFDDKNSQQIGIDGT